MEITQDLVDKIVKRAENSDFSLSEGMEGKSLSVTQYAGWTDSPYANLAMLLVNKYETKYDLISIFQAAMEVIDEESRKEK